MSIAIERIKVLASDQPTAVYELRDLARQYLALDAELDCVRAERDSLRAALAQPEEAQPVVCNPADYCACQHQPLYLHPPAQQTPMTGDDMWKLWSDAIKGSNTVIEFARAVERHHGIGGK